MTSERTRIKICGITRVDDAVAAARAGADAIGVVFWPGTPRVVSHDQARAIAVAVPAFVTVVGLFVDPTPETVRAALAAVPLDLLQFHGGEPGEFCRSFGRRYLKAIPVRDGVDLLECTRPYGDAAGLLFDTHLEGDLPGGTGRVFDWHRLSGDVQTRIGPRMILSGGLDAGNVGRAIREIGPWAVDVSSGVEERDPDGKPRRGLKDAARIAAFVQGVRSADGRAGTGA
ncbi:MAG: phosphoribosylanthranilate isomerase [Betaproteobacteria bacterium]|nr:phosphoribosylanthranilate isomerase [Betaproteobacteria bacterium]MDE2003860.1 phosphoribosylanthranilate isomerase [Betaproteobacteria bacterium]